jgi:hypothetical protein
MKTFAIAALTLSATLCALAADDPKQREDLTSVLALNGKPCAGGVVSYVQQADNDFVATCKDGNRYRVHVKDGRVAIEKK